MSAHGLQTADYGNRSKGIRFISGDQAQRSCHVFSIAAFCKTLSGSFPPSSNLLITDNRDTRHFKADSVSILHLPLLRLITDFAKSPGVLQCGQANAQVRRVLDTIP